MIAKGDKLEMAKVWTEALQWKQRDYQIELEKALNAGNARIAKVCIALGADVNIANAQGVLPLDQVIGLNNVELLQQMAKERVDTDVYRDKQGNTILHRTVSIQRPELVEMLISNINIKDQIHVLNQQMQTPLLCATALGNVEIVNILVKYGADIKVQDNEGNTALHTSVQKENKEIITKLLQSDFEVKYEMLCLKIENNVWKTPIELANSSEITKFVNREKRRIKAGLLVGMETLQLQQRIELEKENEQLKGEISLLQRRIDGLERRGNLDLLEDVNRLGGDQKVMSEKKGSYVMREEERREKASKDKEKGLKD